MMTQTKSKVTDSITLQDLFQLKRAETPPAGFWEQFEDSFHKKSLQAVAESSCQQRRSLLHGWGLGVCMASLLSLGLPIFLFLQSGSSYTSNTLLVNQQVNEVTERAHVVAEVTEQQPWRHVQVVDSRFVIEELEVASVAQPAQEADLRFQANEKDQFVIESLSLSAYTAGSTRTASFF